MLVAEWFYFNAVGRNFGTLDTSFDILRHSVEIGLLALVMTPIILTGGIDLSVGSLLGLCAILFGKFWRDAGLPIPLAAACTLGIGALAGGLNATLITWLRLPPLIVTLGTFSLFRGLAEAITHGVDTFTDFPASFLFLGQERWLGVPAQAPVFIARRGRGLAAGASHDVRPFVPRHRFCARRRALRRNSRRTAPGDWLTCWPASVAALAAIIYTARLGQAKADAGTGYELFAITAVVLGGTSIFGGVGRCTARCWAWRRSRC